MAEDSEKRFHAVMDKLFRSPPKPKSTATTSNSSYEVQLSRGKKRPNSSSFLEQKSRGDMVDGSQNSLVSGGQTPVCRPWDRGDLMRRLATFKSMTWFAKPKVVSAVNCARRGWVNVEMDTIACESCGARLLFSTPSSWTQQQVEKAALVFSLKLDNGHKILCPWIDNSCDEKLAQFPPMPAADLVDDYKKRCSSLSHLLALPVISSEAIDLMRSPPLEHLLTGSLVVDSGNEPVSSSQTEYLGNGYGEDSSAMYYQAQKLISLCGWEPRLVPYIIDYKNQHDQSTKEANPLGSSLVVYSGQNPDTSVYSSSTNQNTETNDVLMASGEMQSDPNSVVLDCRLCGASVGLWAFSTVPRPMELFRLVGFTEINGENDYCNENRVDAREGVTNVATTGPASSSERPSTLNLTIAGGPPPAKQNFRARISLPVIGRNLRARISSDSEFRDPLYVGTLSRGGQSNTASLSVQALQQEDTELSQRKGSDDEHCNSTGNDEFPCLKNDNSEHGKMLTNKDGRDTLVEGEIIGGLGFPETSTPDSKIDIPSQNTPDFIESLFDKDDDNAKVDGTVNSTVKDQSCSQVGDASTTTPDVHLPSTEMESKENDTSIMVEADTCNLKQNPEIETVSSGQVNGLHASGIHAIVQPANNDVPCCLGKNIEKFPVSKGMAFDPIRQHRHFCPWIASVGNAAPGWQQTLSALQRQKEFSCPATASTSAQPSSLIEVDDPVGSVKKLFTPPSAKRLKLTCNSS